jgi:hypothetical protein
MSDNDLRTENERLRKALGEQTERHAYWQRRAARWPKHTSAKKRDTYLRHVEQLETVAEVARGLVGQLPGSITAPLRDALAALDGDS